MEPGGGAGGAALPISPVLTAWACEWTDCKEPKAPPSELEDLRGLEGVGPGVTHRERKLLPEKLFLPLLGGLWEEATGLHLLELAAAYFQIQHLLSIYYVPKE